MNVPPDQPDPNGLTQPIPVVPASAPPSRPAKKTTIPGGPRAPYVHRFGNVPLTLLARFFAFLIDLFGVSFVLTAFGFNLFDRGIQAFAARNEAGFDTLASGSLAVAIVFAYICESLTGTTLGKTVFSLHTRRVDGGHAGGGRILLRYLFAPVDLLLVGPLLALVTPRHQRLGDLLAGTVVSGSRIGLLAPVLGIALIGAIGYAQISYGGGLTSALEVLAETSNVAPGLISKASQAIGLGAVTIPHIPVPALPSASPESQTPAPAAASATATPFSTPVASPSDLETPAASDVPTATASDAPSAAAAQTPDAQESESPAPSQTAVF